MLVSVIKRGWVFVNNTVMKINKQKQQIQTENKQLRFGLISLDLYANCAVSAACADVKCKRKEGFKGKGTRFIG